MKNQKIPYTFCLLFAFLCIALNNKAQSHKSLLTDNPLKTHLDSAVQKGAVIYMANTGTVGLSVGVVQNNHSYIYNYGESNKGSGELLRSDQYFNLGSVAKTFVGTMLAQAVIEKKVKLSDDIRKYLPGKYPNLQYMGHPVKLVDIANHTSGLPGSTRDFPSKVMDSIGNKGLSSIIHFFSLYTQDSMLMDMHHFKIDTIPGTKYHYNGNAMMVLILLLERIYHKPYEELVTNYLRTYLKMNDTRTRIPVNQLKRFIQGHNDDGEPVKWFNTDDHSVKDINTNLFYAGGPSMNSTMSDMVKFLKANIDAKDPAIRLSHQQTWGDPNGFAMGLNWMINQKDGERYYYHDGHTGLGFNTLCKFYPKEKLGFMIMVNDNVSQDKVSELESTIKAAINR
jgi:CubicO group peptidase (beta-lactamase class C family)